MLVVLDNNVIISGLLGSPSCKKIIAGLNSDKFTLAMSPPLFAELCFVLDRPKFRIIAANDERLRLLQFIRSKAITVSPKIPVTVCRDPEDNKVLECALEAKADFVVTGDKDLLILNPFDRIEILSPSNFLKRLGR